VCSVVWRPARHHHRHHHHHSRSCSSPWQLAALTWSLRKTEGMARLHLLAVSMVGLSCDRLDQPSSAMVSKILPQVGLYL
jgi:hypothetical protein